MIVMYHMIFLTVFMRDNTELDEYQQAFMPEFFVVLGLVYSFAGELQWLQSVLGTM